ncbi:MAG: hypothetical protein HZB19_12635 [Chloroflexi bacterium]|nr:hypothetical protein [Chloroflexota bacterium]
MSEQTFSDYLMGITTLLSQLGKEHERYFDILEFQAQLIENIENTRKADTQELMAKRTHIIDQLNRISEDSLNKSFNDICFSKKNKGNTDNIVDAQENMPNPIPELVVSRHDSSQTIDSTSKDIIEVFDRDFVYPGECDDVSSSLRKLAETLSLKQEYLYLEFSFTRKILALANQIDEFRKICQTGTLQVESERRNILNNMENLFEELNDIQNV